MFSQSKVEEGTEDEKPLLLKKPSRMHDKNDSDDDLLELVSNKKPKAQAKSDIGRDRQAATDALEQALVKFKKWVKDVVQ